MGIRTAGRKKSITYADYERIIKLHKAGWSVRQIAEKVCIQKSSVHAYITGKTKYDDRSLITEQ